MSDVNAAIQFVLRQEDGRMTGVITNTPGDRGGRTRWGVAETSHPELAASGFYSSMPTAASLVVAESVYKRAYADPVMLDKINDQRLANAVLSFAINEGPGTAVRVLQQAMAMPVDGAMGLHTIAAVNAIEPTTLLARLGVSQKAHYAAIVAANPSQGEFLHGWNNRVDATVNQA